MQGDEAELEAAGEEAQHQQDIGAVPQRLGQCLLVVLDLRRARRGFGRAQTAYTCL